MDKWKCMYSLYDANIDSSQAHINLNTQYNQDIYQEWNKKYEESTTVSMTAWAEGGRQTIHQGLAPAVWPWSVESVESSYWPLLPWTWSQALGCSLVSTQGYGFVKGILRQVFIKKHTVVNAQVKPLSWCLV